MDMLLLTAGPTLGVANNTLVTMSSSGWWLWPGQRTVVVVCLALVESAGLLLNLAIFTALVWEGAGRAMGGALPLNLLVADLFTTACVLPLLIRYLHKTTWPFAAAGCQLFGFTFQLFGGVSNYTMTAIAIERYYTITHGHQGISTLTRHQGKLVVASWLLSLIVAAPPLFGWSSYHLDAATGTCAPDWTTMDGQHASYLAFLAVFGVLLPVAIQAGCYLKLYNTVFSVARRARASEMSFLQSTVAVISFPMATLAHDFTQPSLETHQDKGHALGSALSIILKRQAEYKNLRRLARLMMCMVLVQVMSWLPYMAGLLVVFCLQGGAYPQALTITMAISTFNVIYNPVMYVYHNKKYRGSVSHCLHHTTSHIRRSCHRHRSNQDGNDSSRVQHQANAAARQVLDYKQSSQQQVVPQGCPQNTPARPAGGLQHCPLLYTIQEGGTYSTSAAFFPDATRPGSHPSVRKSSTGSMVQTPLGSNISGDTQMPTQV